MKREPLSLQHHDLLCAAFRRLQRPHSDYSFANAYLFRDKYRYEVLHGRNLYLWGRRPEGMTFLLAADRFAVMDFAELAGLLKEVDFLHAVPRARLGLFERQYFTVGFWSGDSDYIYARDKLALYPGRKLDGPRNLARQFQREYVAQRQPLRRCHLADAQALLTLWHSQLRDPSDSDMNNCLEALNLLEELPELEGYIWYVRGQPVGLMIGELLTPKTFAVHFMKADKRFKGVYQYLYQSLMEALAPTVRCINLEQDLGKEPLRHAKSAYHPDSRCHKWRALLTRKDLSDEVIAAALERSREGPVASAMPCC